MKCQACHEQKATWAWQPFGPNETPDSFLVLGSHHRGFPVVKVCDTCKLAFQTGDFIVRFTCEGHRFIATDHQVAYEQISLWNAGTSTMASLAGQSATMIMQDTIGEPELVAMVLDSTLVNAFIVAPSLVKACEHVVALTDTIERSLQWSQVQKTDRDAVLMALANVKVTLDEVHR